MRRTLPAVERRQHWRSHVEQRKARMTLIRILFLNSAWIVATHYSVFRILNSKSYTTIQGLNSGLKLSQICQKLIFCKNRERILVLYAATQGLFLSPRALKDAQVIHFEPRYKQSGVSCVSVRRLKLRHMI